MNSETTTCISIENDKKIKEICSQYKISVSKFIIILIKYTVEHKKLSVVANRNIQYRERNGDVWRRIHLQFNPDEYEFLLDVKKIFKMSVAKMVEFCIDNYLYDVICKVLNKNKTDNYLYSNYHFEIGDHKGIVYYQIYWGLPIEKLPVSINAT